MFFYSCVCRDVYCNSLAALSNRLFDSGELERSLQVMMFYPISVFQCFSGHQPWRLALWGGAAVLVLGKLLHLCMAAATYLGVVLVGTALCSLPYAPVTGPGWSTVATGYGAIMEDDGLKTVAVLLPRNLYQQMGPGAAVARSFFLLFLCLVLLGAVLLAASLLRMRFLGVAADAALFLTGAGFVILDSTWMWAFPCAHALTWVHFNPYFRAPVCPLWASALYFLLGSALMTLLACVAAKKRSFDSMLEFD